MSPFTFFEQIIEKEVPEGPKRRQHIYSPMSHTRSPLERILGLILKMSISNQIPIYDNYDLSLHMWQFACTYDLFGDSGVKKKVILASFSSDDTKFKNKLFFCKMSERDRDKEKGISLAQPDSISSTKEVKKKQ